MRNKFINGFNRGINSEYLCFYRYNENREIIKGIQINIKKKTFNYKRG